MCLKNASKQVSCCIIYASIYRLHVNAPGGKGNPQERSEPSCAAVWATHQQFVSSRSSSYENTASFRTPARARPAPQISWRTAQHNRRQSPHLPLGLFFSLLPLLALCQFLPSPSSRSFSPFPPFPPSPSSRWRARTCNSGQQGILSSTTVPCVEQTHSSAEHRDTRTHEAGRHIDTAQEHAAGDKRTGSTPGRAAVVAAAGGGGGFADGRTVIWSRDQIAQFSHHRATPGRCAHCHLRSPQ